MVDASTVCGVVLVCAVLAPQPAPHHTTNITVHKARQMCREPRTQRRNRTNQPLLSKHREVVSQIRTHLDCVTRPCRTRSTQVCLPAPSLWRVPIGLLCRLPDSGADCISCSISSALCREWTCLVEACRPHVRNRGCGCRAAGLLSSVGPVSAGERSPYLDDLGGCA